MKQLLSPPVQDCPLPISTHIQGVVGENKLVIENQPGPPLCKEGGKQAVFRFVLVRAEDSLHLCQQPSHKARSLRLQNADATGARLRWATNYPKLLQTVTRSSVL